MPDSIMRRTYLLLDQAMSLEDVEREAFLLRACRENPELAEHAQRLIAAVNDSRSFLEYPALQLFGAAAWSDDHAPPQTIGNYQIVRRLGSGGMGTVYEAVQKQPNRTVALKIPRSTRWKHDFRRQLEFESEVLARLRHPYIAQVYEAGVDDSDPDHPTPFFAMEFVPSARTIRQYAQDSRLNIKEMLLLVRKACEGIQHAHRFGTIHRDLKPANILVDADGNPKIIDFGVASSHALAETRSEQPVVGKLAERSDIDEGLEAPDIVGTLNYMSPEQCDSSSTIDARTDVYSLGVILYELLCESLPYCLKDKSITEALQIVKQQVVPTAERRGQRLPTDINLILHKALEKDRRFRYSTVEALSNDIDCYLKGLPISARPSSFWYPLRLAVNRNRLLSTAIGLLVIAILTGSISSLVFAFRTAQEVRLRRSAEADALRQLDQAVWQSYVANMHGAFAAFQNREVASVRARLAQAPIMHRNWEWEHLHGLVEINELVVEAHDGLIHSFAASADGTRWATGGVDGTVRVWDSQTGQAIAEFVHTKKGEGSSEFRPPIVAAISFRNGSSQIVSGTSDGLIRIWDVDAGILQRQLSGHRAGIRTLSVRKDGTIISTCSRNRAKLWDGEHERPLSEIKDDQSEISGALFCDSGRWLITWEPLGSIWLRDATTFEMIAQFRFPGNPRRIMTSSDGFWIAAGGLNSRVFLWKTGAPEEEALTIETPGKRSSIDSLCFSPDGTRLACGRVDRQIFEYLLDGFTKVSQLQGHEEYVCGLSYDPSGGRLVSASGDGTLRVWNMKSQILGTVKAAAEQDHHLSSLALSPSGDRIAVSTSDRFIRIYDRQLQLSETLPVKHLGMILKIDWSPKGNQIVSAGIDRSVRIWDLSSGESRALKPAHEGVIRTVGYSPDGRWIVSAGVDRVLRIWNAENGQVEAELSGHRATVISLCFSADSKWLASGAEDGSVVLWDWPRRELYQRLDGHSSDVFTLAFDPSSRRLYSGSRDRTIRVWSVKDGLQTEVLTGHGQLIYCLAIHPVGNRLVAGCWFGDILMWDLERHDLVGTFKGHNDVVYDLKFSPGGNFFVSCSYDKSLRKFSRSATSFEDGKAR